jgi:hypothetical protein
MCTIDYNNKNPSDVNSPYFSIDGGPLEGPVQNQRDMNTLWLVKSVLKEKFGIRSSDNTPSEPSQPPPPAPQATQARQSREGSVTRTKQTQTMRKRTDLKVAEQVNIPRSPLAVMGGGSNSGVNVPT